MRLKKKLIVYNFCPRCLRKKSRSWTTTCVHDIFEKKDGRGQNLSSHLSTMRRKIKQVVDNTCPQFDIFLKKLWTNNFAFSKS